MSSSEGFPAGWRPGGARASVVLPTRWVEADGRAIAFELAIAHGLGLVGEGAPAALRAFLVEAVTTGSPDAVRVVIPAVDLADLLGCRSPGSLPGRSELPVGLEVTATFDDALAFVEATALDRALRSHADAGDEVRWAPTFV